MRISTLSSLSILNGFGNVYSASVHPHAKVFVWRSGRLWNEVFVESASENKTLWKDKIYFILYEFYNHSQKLYFEVLVYLKLI